MIADVRAAFNAAFTEEKYHAFLADLNGTYGQGRQIVFRVAETPVFVPAALTAKLQQAVADIVAVITGPDLARLTRDAIPPELVVPHEDAHTQFLAIDFAVCRDANGELTPQLIELQGFPSLFAYEALLTEAYQRYFPVPATLTTYFNGLDRTSYLALLRRTILADEAPEAVVLLEVEPWQQGTAVDFAITEQSIGIRTVDVTDVEKAGNQLFYQRDGVRTRIKRIYNRVIFDELQQRPDVLDKMQFRFQDADLDVKWAGHPNWFFRLSKYLMPHLRSAFVPQSTLLSELQAVPADMENYVLKPLYSFSGAGVKFHATRADVEAVPAAQRGHWMLQRKVQYEPVLLTPDGDLVKAELRMLLLWPEGDAAPTLAINLARLSKGEMIGVKFNKDKTWVGGTIAFLEGT
ncbi:MAG: hypothetical protein H7330_08445 [Hymenobacteraceae bacterium]|nr:hypothetical protein [Hymenobacteraceae bacterium]